MKNNLLIIIMATVLVAGLSFFAGMTYQKSKNQSTAFPMMRNNQQKMNDTQSKNGSNQKNTNAQRNGRPMSGEIISFDGETLTLKTQDDGNKIVTYSDSTKINKASEGSSADLQTGSQVMVIGTENSDGSVTAETISIGNGFFQNIFGGAQPPADDQAPAMDQPAAN